MDKYVDAKALYSYFKWSGKKHLLITGDLGSGKTTLINALVNIISDGLNDMMIQVNQISQNYQKV